MIARVRAERLMALVLAIGLITAALSAQEPAPAKPEAPNSEPQYQDKFSGDITEYTVDKITVSRSVLGKLEKRSFWIKADTKIEGKLKVKVKVTVGFVTSDEGDVARLIVVRPQKK
jgi:hypothetical protein